MNNFRKNQLVLHRGNICEIDNLFLNKNSIKCCDLLYLDGTTTTALVSDLYPYIGNICLSQFRKKRKNNIFRNTIFKNILILVFIIVVTFILSFIDKNVL